jgi:hypothetical protein
MIGHDVTRYADENGYVASCRCGWRTTRRTRHLRDRDADAHTLTPYADETETPA